jgi:crotonobetainyl-CoA:carnitine CoA-transferase CaiB-like acyl-CoA transferase
MTVKPLPLTGLRVVDLADVWGPLCGRMLADLGASVVRVEPPGGAPTRRFPPRTADGTSLWFAFRNGNKQGATLDLETTQGRAALRDLLADADVCIESSTPGAMAAAGLDFAALCAELPELIVCSITPFGQTGPYARYAATDDVVVAMSGWLATSGIPTKPPLLPPGSIATDAVAVHAVFAVLTALYQRRSTGCGQYLDVSALEALTQLNTWGIPNMSAIVAAGMAKPVVRSGDSPVYPMIPCKDGAIRLVLLAPRQWKAMWEWMGSPEEFADPMWEQTFVRMQNMDVLNAVFAEFFADKTMEDAAAEAQRRGVVATPRLEPGGVLRNEHFVSRGSFVDAEVAPGVVAKVASGFFEFDGERVGYRSGPPTVGEPPVVATALTAPVGASPAAPSPAGAPERTAPLAGLRVLDFGHGGVGVEGGRMLVEYGADVIKIETHTYPDFMRIVLGGMMTPSFASSSRSKRSFAVNVKHADGLRILRDLARHADIVIENNSTGTMTDMGVGFEALHELNPDLVMASSQLVGSRGTCAQWIGYGPTIQPFGGMTYLWAFPDGDGPPGNPAIHPDHLAGRLCAIGALAGVLGRELRGGGSHVEIAQVEGVINTLGDWLAKESLEPGSVGPQGNDDDLGAPWGVFRCAPSGDFDENYAVICVRDDTDWQNLCAAMGQPVLAAQFPTTADRLAARGEVNALVAGFTRSLSPRDVMARCQEVGVPGGAMITTLDQQTDPQLEARGYLVKVDQQLSGPLVFEGAAFTGTAMTPARIEQAPILGEHTREVCREVLGLSEAEIDAAIASGALEDPKR